MADIIDIRNIVLLGHGGSGKTSIAEAVLHTTNATNRLGSVEDKSTVSDYDEEERQRQHSIYSTLMHVNYAGKTINMIDTPGYPDFIGAALVSIPAAEAAIIVISASAGIEVNTRKLFEAAMNAGKPRIIVINKIDADNIDLPGLIRNIHETFGSACRCANLPGTDENTIIDCLTNDTGDSPVMDVATAHTELIESVIEADDKLMESYLGGEEIGADKIASVFVKAMMAGTIVPVVFTNARREVGITDLLDIITKFVPSPADVEPVKVIAGEKSAEIKPDPAGPLAGLVFRIGFDQRSNMKYASIRIFAGKLTPETAMLVNEERKPLRPGHILKLQGGETSEIQAGITGDIVTLAKIDEIRIGDLVHDGKFPGRIQMPRIPTPMYALALEPAARGDEQKISSALEKVSEENICFKITRDPQTKELVINGLGDLHLRVVLSRLEKRYKLAVKTKQPKIPYRETITGKAEGHYRHKKQTGGAGQFGEVYLRIEPAERDSDPPVQISWDIFGGTIPSQYEPAVAKGIFDVMENGFVAGFPIQDIKVSVYDGKYHPVDSKEVAFRAAGKGAFLDALEKAKPALLEPIVNIEITIPAANMGDITGDLASRRGRIQGQEMLAGNMVVIKAQVPLSEVAQYDSQLKSVTGGQGSYSMELSHYEPVPPNVQQQVIQQYAKKKVES
ncbi:MAG: elongation factor G [Planctomycetota bacterium]